MCESLGQYFDAAKFLPASKTVYLTKTLINQGKHEIFTKPEIHKGQRN